jgi:hypothetical protein
MDDSLLLGRRSDGDAAELWSFDHSSASSENRPSSASRAKMVLRAFLGVTQLMATMLLAALGCANITGIEDAKLQIDQSTGGTGSTEPDPTLCSTYCDAVLANCTGGLSVYASRETCMGVCSQLRLAGKTGTPNDQSGNTVHCRLTQARSAKSTGEPTDYCFAAGPGGGNICGTNCEGYCVLLQQTCPLEFATAQFNNSVAYCLTNACPSIPTLDAGFNDEQQSGNNINCRLYHVSAANADGQAAGTHCPHAAGASPCTD